MNINGVKPLPASQLQLAQQVNQEFLVDLAVVRKTDGSQVALEDLFAPSSWAKCTGVLKVGDLLRVKAADRSFDFQLVVAAAAQGGLLVKHFPHVPPGIRETEQKVRTEQLAEHLALNQAMLSNMKSGAPS